MKGWLVVLMLAAGVGMADLPTTSERPPDRSLPAAGPVSIPAADPVSGAVAPRISLRPQQRTRSVLRTIRRYQRQRAEGTVCDDPAIQGEPIGPVSGAQPGCGVAQAVRVRSVSGVALSDGAVMDCGTAAALRTWVDGSVIPTLRQMGGGVSGLQVAAHYACRTRNNRPGARISEHGRGRAIDISGFRLRDGSAITVLRGWTTGRAGRALRRMHEEACGPFGTVLGPNADRHHRDHFHFDTARYRTGSYCR